MITKELVEEIDRVIGLRHQAFQITMQEYYGLIVDQMNEQRNEQNVQLTAINNRITALEEKLDMILEAIKNSKNK